MTWTDIFKRKGKEPPKNLPKELVIRPKPERVVDPNVAQVIVTRTQVLENGLAVAKQVRADPLMISKAENAIHAGQRLLANHARDLERVTTQLKEAIDRKAEVV